jgi:hypothetical protein
MILANILRTIRLKVSNTMLKNFKLLDSPLKRGDKGVCKIARTHPRPLFLEGSLKVAAYAA